MQVIFALIALSVSYFSFKIYKISRQREIKLFGISFLLISFSYILWAMINSAVAYPTLIKVAQLLTENISRLGGAGILTHFILLISGLVTLAYTTLKTKSGKVYYLILGLGIMVIIAPLFVVLVLFEPINSSFLQTLILT